MESHVFHTSTFCAADAEMWLSCRNFEKLYPLSDNRVCVSSSVSLVLSSIMQQYTSESYMKPRKKLSLRWCAAWMHTAVVVIVHSACPLSGLMLADSRYNYPASPTNMQSPLQCHTHKAVLHSVVTTQEVPRGDKLQMSPQSLHLQNRSQK